MKSSLLKLLFFVILIFPSFYLFSQKNTVLWKALDASVLERNLKGKKEITPQKAFTFSLDYPAFLLELSNAPLRFSKYEDAALPQINLPMPDGSNRTFLITEAPTMHPDLQNQFPRIRSYSGYDMNDRSATIRFSTSPKGLAAMIMDVSQTIYIDTYAKETSTYYNSYFKGDFNSDKKLSCGNLDDSNIGDTERIINAFRTGDGQMRKYRLALACTGEYAKYHGGKVEDVVNAMNKTMTRVNGVYEKEFSITMEIIPNNTKLIFLNAITDGYTNDRGATMLGENQAKCDALIGSANYDIGHVFSTGGGGIANLGSPCSSTNKAKGVTGLPNPVSDPFDIDYVCHEMGHQFGAQHTFNNSCNGNISTTSSYEPGSGSTIMGYAGICPPVVQANSDAYFHAISIAQINQFVLTGSGNNCAAKIAISNKNEPVVNAGDNYTIPKDTPFELIGSAKDDESAAINLSYCWEEYDREVVAMPPTGLLNSGPLFRSISPQRSPIRVFPPMTTIVKNSKNTWEVLPKVARSMNFRLTVRDNDVNGGTSGVDAMRINVADTGPFIVTYPDATKITWTGGQNETITWSVAQTDVAPVSTAQVMILLSSDGGYTYPDTLAKAVPNTGSATIQVPVRNISKARIKIKGLNNIFFDISNNDFVIQKPLVSSFTFPITINEIQVCTTVTDSVQVDLTVGTIAGFKEKVALSVVSIPPSAKYTLSQDTITPFASVKLTIYNLKNSVVGKFSPIIKGVSGSQIDSFSFPLSTYSLITATPDQVKPRLYSRAFGVKAPFIWRKINGAEKYIFELSKDADFGTIEETATVSDTQYVAKKISAIQIYYWRVKASNPCNTAAYSAATVFQTGALNCDTLRNTNPTTIPITASEVASKIEVSKKGILGDLEIYTKIDHPYLSDLSVELENPNGLSTLVFEGACSDRNNVDATFTDTGNNLSCALTSPAIKNRVKPKEPFSTFYNQDYQGTWTLRIKDRKLDDGGILQSWNLRVCKTFAPDSTLVVETDTLLVTEGQLKNIGDDLFTATSIGLSPDKFTYRILKLPAHGVLKRGSSIMSVGSTITQQQINTGELFFQPESGTGASTDNFSFETRSSIGGWIPVTDFPIKIKENIIKINVVAIHPIRCYGGNDAKISIDAINGTPPLQYKIDNSDFRFSNVFDSLKAGTYQITVKDNEGVFSYFKLNVNEPTQIIAKMTNDSTTVKLLISGGTPAYQINYEKGGFSENNEWKNQLNGWHFYEVRDSNNCIISDSFQLKVNPLRIEYLHQSPTCSYAADGTITVAMNTGKAPYQYKINQGLLQSSPVFTGLAAGSYIVSVSDADGFSRAININLSAPKALDATVITRRDSLILEASGGIAPYQFSIDDGKNYQSSPIFPNLMNGSYLLAILDSNGCNFKKTYTFTGTTSLTNEIAIQVYPNPANAHVDILLEKGYPSALQIALVNAQGQEIFHNEIPAGDLKYRLITEAIPAGFYHIIIGAKTFDKRIKLLIIR
ncbi:MAG: reprolysin-like metallopeptidase [Saprospiraceae bacterium]